MANDALQKKRSTKRAGCDLQHKQKKKETRKKEKETSNTRALPRSLF
jgi:hypothetical protein